MKIPPRANSDSRQAGIEETAPGDGRRRLDYRAIWISDVHLGTRGCKAEYLLDFLNHSQSEYLYLVGDIVDLWKFKSGFYWPAMHNHVVRAIMDKAKSGTRVIYIPGNHDETFRGYVDMEFNSIEILDRAIHRTADGRTFLVLHGDEFDGVTCSSKWLAYLGSEAYDFLVFLNRWYNVCRRKLGFGYWSLSAYLKHKVKNAVNFINDFRQALIREAHNKGVDGVICGHIHHADIAPMGDTLIYCNCGDWVESCTALAESSTGELSIIRWAEESVFLLNEGVHIETGTDIGRLATAD